MCLDISNMNNKYKKKHLHNAQLAYCIPVTFCVLVKNKIQSI